MCLFETVKVTAASLFFSKIGVRAGEEKSAHIKMGVAGVIRAAIFLSLTAGVFAALGAAMAYGLPRLGQKYSQVANFLQQHSQVVSTAQKVNLFAGLLATGSVAGFLLRQAYADHTEIHQNTDYATF